MRLLVALWLAGTAHAGTRTGLDVLVDSGFAQLKGKRVGLITNHTGKDRDGRSNIQLFAKAPGLTLAAVFTPEHGLQGTNEEWSIASSSLTLADGRVLPLYSLYGSTKAPTPEMLQGLDALVFDIQDIGARFYTYTATMGMAMDKAGEAGIEFFVLDRPNPVDGDTIEGPVIDRELMGFYGYFPVPIRYGMTLGELALLHQGLGGSKARLHVVAMKDWTRKMWQDDTGLPWIKPSPNMPNLDAAALYAGLGGFDYANVSVGRGTPLPFQWVGAKWMDADAVVKRMQGARLKGVTFARRDFTPDKGDFEGQACRRVAMTVTDRESVRSMRVFAHLVCALRDLHPKEFKIDWKYQRLLMGTEEFWKLLQGGAGPEELISFFDKGTRDFRHTRKPYLIYP
jgi:uncharacterized protein YbbC (DUF1343 family)